MNRKPTTTIMRSFAARVNAFPLRATISQALVLVLFLQTCVLPSAVVAAPSASGQKATAPAAQEVVTGSEAAAKTEAVGESSVVAAAVTQSFGVGLSELATEFRGHAGLDYHQPSGRPALLAVRVARHDGHSCLADTDGGGARSVAGD